MDDLITIFIPKKELLSSLSKLQKKLLSSSLKSLVTSNLIFSYEEFIKIKLTRMQYVHFQSAEFFSDLDINMPKGVHNDD